MAASASVSASGPLPPARIAVIGSSSPTASSFSSAAASCGARIPASASNGVSAHRISGLGQSSA